MKVRALKTGYYKHLRRYPEIDGEPADVFEMDEDDYQPKDKYGKPIINHKTGQPQVCSWVEIVGKEEERPAAAKVNKSSKHRAKQEVQVDDTEVI